MAAGLREITASPVSSARNSHTANSQPSSAHGKTYRVRGMPLQFTKRQAEDVLRSVLRLDEAQGTVQVRSIAPSPNGKTKVATLEFKSRPPCFLSDQHEWSFEIPSTDKNDFVGSNYEDDDDIIPAAPIITIDDHFNGITILRSFKNISEHKIELVSSYSK